MTGFLKELDEFMITSVLSSTRIKTEVTIVGNSVVTVEGSRRVEVEESIKVINGDEKNKN